MSVREGEKDFGPRGQVSPTPLCEESPYLSTRTGDEEKAGLDKRPSTPVDELWTLVACTGWVLP